MDGKIGGINGGNGGMGGGENEEIAPSPQKDKDSADNELVNKIRSKFDCCVIDYFLLLFCTKSKLKIV